jgi:hypothetical protein
MASPYYAIPSTDPVEPGEEQTLHHAPSKIQKTQNAPSTKRKKIDHEMMMREREREES